MIDEVKYLYYYFLLNTKDEWPKKSWFYFMENVADKYGILTFEHTKNVIVNKLNREAKSEK